MTRHFTRRILRGPFLCLCLLAMAGCLGGPAPAERLLRLDPFPVSTCGASADEARPGRILVALKDLDSAPGLDRTAVLLARGPVLTPSTAWYWEGPPAELLGEALAARLRCSDTAAAVRPYRPRTIHDALVSGRALAFEVRQGSSPSFRAAFQLDLWSPRGERWLAGRSFQADAPLEALDPASVARAAQAATAQAVEQAAAWIEVRTRP